MTYTVAAYMDDMIYSIYMGGPLEPRTQHTYSLGRGQLCEAE